MENEIQVTSIQIKKLEHYTVKGIATIVLNNSICIKGIKIIEKDAGSLQIRMPNIKNIEGKFKDIVFPINSNARAILEKAILDEYNKKNNQF